MLRLLIIVPFLAILVVLLLFNPQSADVSVIITSWNIVLGVFILILGVASFAVGALVVFISLVGQWRRARKAEQKIRGLEDQLNELRAQYIALTQQPAPSHSTTASVAQQIASANTLLESTGEEDISR